MSCGFLMILLVQSWFIWFRRKILLQFVKISIQRSRHETCFRIWLKVSWGSEGGTYTDLWFELVIWNFACQKDPTLVSVHAGNFSNDFFLRTSLFLSTGLAGLSWSKLNSRAWQLQFYFNALILLNLWVTYQKVITIKCSIPVEWNRKRCMYLSFRWNEIYEITFRGIQFRRTRTRKEFNWGRGIQKKYHYHYNTQNQKATFGLKMAF